VFGDFGGVKEVIITILAFLLSPLAEHAFLGKAISKLYMARSKTHSFEPKKGVKSLNKRQKMKKMAENLPDDKKKKLSGLN
jgi:hypothetical protein